MSGDLAELLEAGDEAGTVALLCALPGAERRKLAKLAAAAKKRFDTGAYETDARGTSSWQSLYTDAQRQCAMLAVLATCTAAELTKVAKGNRLPDEAVALWRALRPDFLDQAAELVVDANIFNWGLARILVRQGLSRRPRSDNYTLGLVSAGITPWSRGRQRTLVEHVLDDPGLLKEEIWRLFEVEGGGEHSLADYDKYRGSWADTFLALMKGGHLSRERLLDASLAALERDFSAFRAGWFSRFHEALEPTPGERQARLEVYARLLASPIPATGSFALRALQVVDAAAPLPAASLAPYVTRVLTGTHKGPAKETLALLSAMAKREPGALRVIGEAAAVALSHEAKEVQEATLDLLDRVEAAMTSALRADVAERAAHVAASLRKRAAKWTAGRVKSVAMPAIAPVPPRGAGERDPVAPLASLDELVDACARVLEDDGDPMLVERVLDGISSLCAERPPDFALRTGPLAKRARAIAQRVEHPVAQHVADVVVAWLDGDAGEAPDPDGQQTLTGFLAARAHELATRVAHREARRLLSLPTHRPAWIDGHALVARVDALPRGSSPEPFDAVLALLRLAPEGKDAALAKLGALHAFRRDETLEEPRILATSRQVNQWSGPDLLLSGRRDGPFRLDDPPAILHTRRDAYGASEVAGFEKHAIRWAATVWPSGLEAFFADGARQLARNLDWSSAHWEHAAYLEPLSDRGTAMGPVARLLLVLGLAAKEPGESALAVDAAIAALEDGRLDGRALGEAMARLHLSGLVKDKRWARTLGVVARASPSCATAVRVAIQAAMRGDPTKAPRDEGALVELLCELLAEVDGKIADAEAWTYLAASRHARRLAPLRPG